MRSTKKYSFKHVFVIETEQQLANEDLCKLIMKITHAAEDSVTPPNQVFVTSHSQQSSKGPLLIPNATPEGAALYVAGRKRVNALDRHSNKVATIPARKKVSRPRK